MKLIKVGFILMLLQGCCKPDAQIDDPCGQSCQPYEICEEGYCNCEVGLKRIFGECVEITDDIYSISGVNCYCFNKAYIKVKKQNFTSLLDYMFELNYPDKNRVYASYASYYSKWDGDSIIAYDIIRPICDINGSKHAAMFVGKFHGNDTIEGWIKWYKYITFPFPAPTITDSCRITFVKEKL